METSSTLEVLTLLFLVIDAVLFLAMAIRFGRRVWRKIREPAFGLMGKKVFLLWTWFVFLFLLVTMLAAALAFILTRDIWLSLSTLALGSVIAVFLWLIWAIVPATEESVRKGLEP